MSFEDDLDLVEVAIWLAILAGIAYVVWKYVIPLFQAGTAAAGSLSGASNQTTDVIGQIKKWMGYNPATGAYDLPLGGAPAATSQTCATIQCKMPCGQQSSGRDVPISATGSPAGGGCAPGQCGCCWGVHCCLGS